LNKKLYNHIAPGLSKLESEMVKFIPPGGNWQNIPVTIPSQRLKQIRRSGGRTTYYGRLIKDKPSYTITTYFHRLGNGCNLHPSQDRIISTREGARLQSFKDSFIFYGSKTSQYSQIGNAVPPLLSRVIAKIIKEFLNENTFLDLFAGAGGMSEGFLMEKFCLLGANEIEQNFFKTYIENHKKFDQNNNFILGDITTEKIKNKLISLCKDYGRVGVIIGGPPCQGFSHAGWRNPNDKRNQLFKDFVNIVKNVKPEFFVMENVPGILTIRKGEAIKEVVSSFEEIGYNVNDIFKLNAEDFGVPQRRKRVLIIGSRKKIKIPSPKILFSYKNSDLPDPITVEEAIGGLPKLKSGMGEFETTFNRKSTSAYESFIMGEIDFNVFYEKCFDREKKKLPVDLSLFG